ncbi:MAG TPA: hypothetical protein VLR26_14205 [Frankiaceae bacterium]|nr:hypothetical protein [Frankiaceae bacterium]
MDETMDTDWDDARDGQFYRMVADLFPPAFLAGASALLASYDESRPAVPPAVTTPAARRPMVPVPRQRG